MKNPTMSAKGLEELTAGYRAALGRKDWEAAELALDFLLAEITVQWRLMIRGMK